MSRQSLIAFGLVAAAGLAGAYALGVFDAAEPASDAPASASTPARPDADRDTATAPAPTPRPEPTRPSPSRPAPPTSTPVPAEPEAPTTATLHITSDVPGAQVFLDNKFVGTSPATADNVVPGQRKINVQAPGYEGVVEFVDVSAGPRDLMISLKTIRLDQKVSVVHKHRLGSCSGTLIATPDGVRYVTDNKDDGFVVTLQNIETFQADFLQKNLRIKIRGGRTYEFTDPSGKADALYLFHQEVDKVRQRVK
jgi:hypothetical protein